MKTKTLLWVLVFLLCIGAASAALSDNVDVCYDFEGDADDYYNRYNGTVNGAFLTTGIIGQAYGYNASGDEIDYGTAQQLGYTNEYFTVRLWVKPNTTNNMVLAGRSNWDTDGWLINEGIPVAGMVSPYMVWSYSSAKRRYCYTTDTACNLTTNNWHHIVTQRTGTGVNTAFKFWVNGNECGSVTCTGDTPVGDPRNESGQKFLTGTTNRTYNDFSGAIDEIAIWRRNLTALEIAEDYDTGMGTTCDFVTAQQNTTLNITAIDDWDGTTITTFNVTLDWSNGTTENYGTTTGTVALEFLRNDSLTVNVSYWNITDYFNTTMLNQVVTANTSNYVIAQPFQAYACFNATAKVSDAALTLTNITIGSNATTSLCFNLTAASHNVMGSLTNWPTHNQTFTITALSNATYTIENMSYTNLTIYAKDVSTGDYIANYQLNLTSINHTGWAGEHYANTTNQTFDLINGTYNVVIDLAGYALQDTEANISVAGATNYTFQLYPTNSLNITFYDEDTGATMPSINITYEIILDDANATTGNINTSTAWHDNLAAGDYEIRYRATAAGYGERSYYFTLSNRTYNALSLYLLNDSSTESITTTLYDEYGNKLEGYTIRLLRYYASQNGYVVVDEGMTNSEGQTVVSAIRNGPYYKFRIVSPASAVLKTTTSTQLYDTSISLYVTLGEGIGQQLENLNDVSYELVWLNASDQFRFTWDAADGLLINVTTYAYLVDALDGDTLYNSTTSLSASGTMYVGVLRQNDTTYKAMAYVTFTDDTEPTLMDTLTVTFDETIAVFGTLGLILTFIIVTVLALTGLINPAAPCILVPLSLILTRIATLHALEWTWIVAIAAVGAIILYIIRDKT